MSINRVVVTGNLTRDPELRSTAGGTAVLSFGLAVNDRRRNPQSGEWENVPNFIDCTIFGARAEGVSKYIAKGTKVAIEGKLRWSQWERDGQKHSKIEIVVDEIEFLSQRQQNAPQGQYQQQPTNYPPQQQMPVYGQQAAFQGQATAQQYPQAVTTPANIPAGPAQIAQQLGQQIDIYNDDEIPF